MAPLDVSIRQLEYIVAVADRKGFRRAAEACDVAQPSLSMQVALAERQLGVQIFERDSRSVRPSVVGTAIIEQARRVLLAAHELRELARQSADPFQGTLRLGVIPTIGPYLLPEITPALARTFPHLQLFWTEARTGDLVHELKEGGLDAVLLALEADVGDLDHEVIARDPFVLAASPKHPLVKGSTATSPDVLNGQVVLLLDDGHCFREQALSYCTQASAGEHSFRATSLATLVQMVSAGTAVTLLPSLALPVENRRGQLRVRRFTTPEPGRTIALAWRRGSALRQPLITLAETIRASMMQRPGSRRSAAVPSAAGFISPDGSNPSRDADHTDADHADHAVHGSDHHGTRSRRLISPRDADRPDAQPITSGTRITRIHFSRDADYADSPQPTPMCRTIVAIAARPCSTAHHLQRPRPDAGATRSG